MSATLRNYDIAVVGGGMSGLTAGALLARAGKKVLVVEAKDKPGGYARAIDSGGYRFDPAVHFVMGGNRHGPFGPGLIRAVLDLVNFGDRCELLASKSFYTARFPDVTIEIPTGREAYLAAHARHFPSEERGLTELVDLCARLYAEFVRFPISPRAVDFLTMPIRFPHLARYRKATVQQVVDRYLQDPRLKAIYCALSLPYVGLPPSKAAFTIWATMMASYIEEGAYYARGGFQRLADAFAQGLQNHGGELIVGRRVNRILLSNHNVKGIILDGGEQVTAQQVLSTIDARETFGTLIETNHLPGRWMRKIRDTDVSISIFAAYLGTDLDIAAAGAPRETIIYPAWDLEEVFRAGLAGRTTTTTVTIPTVSEPELAPPNRHQVLVATMAPAHRMDFVAAQIQSNMIHAAEKVVPGLRDHIVLALGTDGVSAQPSTLPLHEIGPIYGWSLIPGNSGPSRLPQITPIGGLYLAGHWTQPGYSIWGVIASGLRATRLMLQRHLTDGLQPIDRFETDT